MLFAGLLGLAVIGGTYADAISGFMVSTPYHEALFAVFLMGNLALLTIPSAMSAIYFCEKVLRIGGVNDHRPESDFISALLWLGGCMFAFWPALFVLGWLASLIKGATTNDTVPNSERSAKTQ